MKAGTASQTAVITCMGRALGHGQWPGSRFEDPTALALLPDEARSRVEAIRAGRPGGFGDRLRAAFLARQSQQMVVRTVAIDDAIRTAAAPQVVLLGAGLDGRAYRMAELGEATVFEVDHPDTQREKRARAAALPALAREVRYVPVDFARDDLDAALAAAGHDPGCPTMWVWEGVVMYLAPAEVEASLALIARRSATGSRLVVLYHCPALMQKLIGVMVARLGEPLRSIYTPDAMRALLARHGFAALDDTSIAALGRAHPEPVARGTRVMNHLRVVLAERR